MTARMVDAHAGAATADGIVVDGLTHREVELGAIIDAYNRVTEKLKDSHEVLTREVRRLHDQLKAKDEELARRKRLAALGEMAAGVAHEVRNPLGGILLCASMLKADVAGAPKARKLAEQIVVASRRLEQIVSDILAFAGDGARQQRAVDLRALVTNVLTLLAPASEAAGCVVTMHCDEGAGQLRGDETQLQRAVLNVMANAIDAARSRVWLEVQRVQAAVRICVADDGGGVPADSRDRVFDPFFTTKDSGTGLGLAIVHRVMEWHGGRVVIGDREGGGAEFTLILPADRGAG